jgi:hypothetical protein
LHETLQKQSVLNGDETGWKVMGVSGYIWCFVSVRPTPSPTFQRLR